MTLGQKLWQMSWGLVLVTAMIAGIGFAMLYSAANGNLDPWASKQMIRFGGGLLIMFAAALTDIRIWFRLMSSEG